MEGIGSKARQSNRIASLLWNDISVVFASFSVFRFPVPTPSPCPSPPQWFIVQRSSTVYQELLVLYEWKGSSQRARRSTLGKINPPSARVRRKRRSSLLPRTPSLANDRFDGHFEIDSTLIETCEIKMSEWRVRSSPLLLSFPARNYVYFLEIRRLVSETKLDYFRVER